jgi:hypothetical protein
MGRAKAISHALEVYTEREKKAKRKDHGVAGQHPAVMHVTAPAASSSYRALRQSVDAELGGKQVRERA